MNTIVSFHSLNLDVVNGLVCIFILEAVPRFFEFLGVHTFNVIHAHSQQDHHVVAVFEVTERKFDLTIVIDLQAIITEALAVVRAAKLVILFHVRTNGSSDSTVGFNYMNLRVVLRRVCFHEGIVSNCKSKTMQTFELKFIEGVRAVDDRVTDFFLLLGDSLNVCLKRSILFLFKSFKHFWSFHELNQLASERRDLSLVVGIEDEVNDTTVFALDEARLLSILLLGNHAGLDALFLFGEDLQLVINHTVQKNASVLGLLGVGED